MKNGNGSGKNGNANGSDALKPITSTKAMRDRFGHQVGPAGKVISGNQRPIVRRIGSSREKGR